MIRARHKEASTVILKHLKLELPKNPLSHKIFVDALYFGRVPTTEDPEGRHPFWIYCFILIFPDAWLIQFPYYQL